MYYCRVKGSKQPIYVKYRILVGVAKGREIFPLPISTFNFTGMEVLMGQKFC